MTMTGPRTDPCKTPDVIGTSSEQYPRGQLSVTCIQESLNPFQGFASNAIATELENKLFMVDFSNVLLKSSTITSVSCASGVPR